MRTHPKKTLVATIAATLMLLLVLTSGSLAATPDARGTTPFNGSFSGAEIDNPVFPTMTVDGNVAGEALHLGSFTYHYNAAVDMQTGYAPETAQFVAANGDRIYAEGLGYGVNEGNPPVSATITEWMTITGGTGRFKGVSGNYTIHRTAAISPELTTTQATFEGTMVMPQGNK
jgi:hypothetical protein